MTHTDAELTCIKHQARPASIHSEEENELVAGKRHYIQAVSRARTA